MATKYDWGDGKGKAHSRPKKNRGKGGGGGASPSTSSAFDIAMDMATKAFKPVLQHARAQVRDAQKQVAPGGVIDSAYDRSGQAIKDAQTAAATQATGAAQAAGDVAKFGVEQATELGAAQSAETARQAQLYGQTADAAKAAVQRQGASGQVLASGGADIAGLIAALQQNNATLGTSRVEASEARRGEARKAGEQEVRSRQDKVTELRTERGAQAQKTAAEMAKADAEFELAMETLDVKDRDSLRDFRASRLGTRAQTHATDTAADTADKNRSSSETIAGNKLRSTEKLSKKDRLAKYDTNRNGRLDKGDKGVNTSAGGRATVTYHTSEGKVQVTPGQHNKAVEERKKIVSRIDAVRGPLTEGKIRNADDARKVSGIKDPRWASFAFDVAVASQQNNGKLTIPKKYRSLLEAAFPGGRLPFDIGKALR